MIVRDYQGQHSERSHSLWPQASLGGLSSLLAKHSGNAAKHPECHLFESPSVSLIQHQIYLVLMGNRALPSPSRPQVQCKLSNLIRGKNNKKPTQPENNICASIALGLSLTPPVTLQKVNAVRCQDLFQNKQQTCLDQVLCSA